MRDQWVPENCEVFSLYLKEQREIREKPKEKTKSRPRKRNSLSSEERDLILKKTDHKCHVCGGPIDGYWEADHVLAHSGGGNNSVDNYLPAHRTCNNYRWDYLPEEFQEILRLGVWLRTQIENQTPIGKSAGESFIRYEKGRIARRGAKRT